MIFVALDESAQRGELYLVNGGLCRWHKRRDGTVVIREIIVLPKMRRRGIGRSLIARVRAANPASALIARCPRAYESNLFWSCMGFILTETTDKANTWYLAPN